MSSAREASALAPQESEAELERFRRQWQEEVRNKTRNKQSVPQASSATSTAVKPERRKPAPSLAAKAVKKTDDAASDDDEEARTYHDLPDNEAELRLNASEAGLVRGASKPKEPQSALEHYEKAVERETQGSLGDSLKHYRRAFKLDDRVDVKYKNKHFPPSAFPPKPPVHSHPPPTSTSTSQQQQQQQQQHQKTTANVTFPNASVTVPSAANATPKAPTVPASLAQLIADFQALTIPGAPPPTDADPAPPCPIAALPAELLTEILTHAALKDLAALSRVSQVCKRLAYLVMTDDQIWKRIATGPEYGFGGMHYAYVCDLAGNALLPDTDTDIDSDADLPPEDDFDTGAPAHRRRLAHTTPQINTHLLHTHYASSHRTMFRQRPRLRFNGAYISTVNYNRPGAASTDSRTWGQPIHIVTYFRYLRFFRDGSVVSLLTVAEPAEVVPWLTKGNLPRREGGGAGRATHAQIQGQGQSQTPQPPSLLPSSVMKDALRGRWRLSGPGDGTSGHEPEGDVHIETEGVVPKYMWKMQFGVGGAAGARGKNNNNKLSWKGFWSYNRLTDDWGEFGLKNDKAFYFSRVRSYGRGE